MIQAVQLSATKREKAGKGASRAVRRSGFVPAVVYGDKLPPEMISIEEKFLVARDAYYVLSQKQSIQMAPYERCYESKTKLQRFLTVFAGPFMNFVLAFLIFLVVGLASGVPNTESSEIGGLTEGYGAASVLQVGDVITKLDDTEINSWTDISTYLNSQLGAEEVSVTFERNGETKTGLIKITF